MANAYVNFYARLDPRGAQAFEDGATQAHRAEAAVGAAVASRTAIALSTGTFHCEIKPTSGNVFACIAPTDAVEATLTAKRIRIDEGEKTTLCLNGRGADGFSLYLWAV